MLQLITDPIFIKGLLAALLLGFLGGFLSPLIISRRLAFYADSFSHALLIGLVISVLLGVFDVQAGQLSNPGVIKLFDPVTIVVMITAVTLATGLYVFLQKLSVSADTGIMFLFYGILALAIFLMGTGPEIPDQMLHNFLFGSLQGINAADLIGLGLVACFIFIFFMMTIKKWLLLVWNEEMASMSGIRVGLFNYLFLVVLSVVVALGIRLVGNLLFGALLVIPGVGARNLARSFTGFLGLSTAIGLFSGLIGYILASPLVFNTFPGPTIIMVGIGLFFVTLGLKIFSKVRV